MSAYYSRFDLNTYKGCAYFNACVPLDYPIDKILIKCRAFRRLPPNLRILAGLSRKWVRRIYGPNVGTNDIDKWYDDEGYELEPGTGRRLTDEEVDASWGESYVEPDVKVQDIPIPDGGFPDPETWQEPPPEPDTDESDYISRASLLKDIKGYGRGYVAIDYGVTEGRLKNIKTDEQLADLILMMHGRK